MEDDARAMDADARRARCQKLAKTLNGQMATRTYDALRAHARAFQRRESSAMEFAKALVECARGGGMTRAMAREVIATTPAAADRRRLRACVGRDLDDDAAMQTTPGREKKSQCKVERLGPGLVCLRKFLSVETQIWLARESFALGESESDGAARGQGFFAKGDDGTFKLNQGSRGRMILEPDAFPDGILTRLCADAVTTACAADDDMPTKMNPTTCLVNFYKDGAEFKWHKDSEDPKLVKSRTGPPIVSFSVGLSGDFGYKYSFDDPEHRVVRLNSGDVLLFGGPSRMIVHSVLNVYPGSMPGHLRGKMLNGRLNVTVRDVGDGVIDVSQFPAYRVSYDGVQAEGHV
jgi:hypothetical protein